MPRAFPDLPPGAPAAVRPSHLLGEFDSAMASPPARVASRQLAEMGDGLLPRMLSRTLK